MRRKVSGRTKTQVKDKLKALHDELREGLHTSATYTVQNAVDDWLANGLDGRSAKTVSTNREVLAPLTALIGSAKLQDLTARRRQVGAGEARRLTGRPGPSRSPATAWSARSGTRRPMISSAGTSPRS